MAQAEEYLLWKHETPEFKPQYHQNKQTKKKQKEKKKRLEKGKIEKYGHLFSCWVVHFT
jgi:hypothetical protein